jgi:osmotically-inducible protein OsmY
MPNRDWNGRDMDERDIEERSNYYGQGGWRGDERMDRDERWGRPERWWMDRDRDRGWWRDDRWRRDMGRDFHRHEWSPYDRRMHDDYRYRDMRESGFGFGGTDRGFGGGGYGGYGYPERGMGMGYAPERGMRDYRERSMDRREGGFFGPGSGMFDRRGRAPRGYQRSDERIKEDLCDRLMHSWIDAENVEIEVKNGEIVLSGSVENRHEKRMIEDMAEDVLGVKDVQNRIRVGHRGAEPQQTMPSGTRKPTA